MKKDEIADYGDSSILTELSLADKWIKSRLNHTIKQLDKALEEYKVNEYSKLLYEFIWRDFCDWYIEIFKVQFNSSDIDEYKSGLTNYALGIYSDILRLLHPLMPFITEEIYHIIFETDANKSISVESVPEADESSILEEIEDEFYSFQLMIDEIRSLRSQMNINPSQKLPIIIVSKDTRLDDIFRNLISVIKNFGRATEVELVREFQKPRNSISSVVRENEIFIVLDDTIDLEQERKRLGKEQERLENNIRGTESKLNNESFVSKAPANIIAFEREKLESMKETLKKIITNIESLN
jgi:valyl-tRNA synthetase